MLRHARDHRVPAGDDQRDNRRLEIRLLQERGLDVAFEMIDADQRHAQRPSDRFRRGDADHERADETRPDGHCNGIDIAHADVRVGEGLLDRRVYRRHVRAAGKLGNDTAEACVQVDL